MECSYHAFLLQELIRKNFCTDLCLVFFVKVLIANKANVDAGTIHGVTPLMLAAWRDYVDIVKALMAAGNLINL